MSDRISTAELPQAPKVAQHDDLADAPFDGISKANLSRADAKAELCLQFDQFLATSGATLEKSLVAFVGLYSQTKSPIDASAETRALNENISAASLQRDWRRFKRGGVPALVPRFGNRRDKSIIEANPELYGFILANISHNPHVRAPWLLAAIKVRFPRARCPKLSALKAFLSKWKGGNKELFDRIADPDGWRHRHMTALGRMDAEVVRCNAI
jgi:putative transposase